MSVDIRSKDSIFFTWAMDQSDQNVKDIDALIRVFNGISRTLRNKSGRLSGRSIPFACYPIRNVTGCTSCPSRRFYGSRATGGRPVPSLNLDSWRRDGNGTGMSRFLPSKNGRRRVDGVGQSFEDFASNSNLVGQRISEIHVTFTYSERNSGSASATRVKSTNYFPFGNWG
ncbi:hypothetical protein B0H16DRAFT_1821425 [Mycena metata]|uniref:Uncharacterized protein n=1 Tax=Mycena metata TaxID=1033252 RepID=A0AAD7H0V7_9AGAR|nr:hypothetical protein B0H16DRAFT_1821425 [Mycena metata]